MKDIKQLKMTSGEEIVCEIVEWPDEDETDVVVKNSYKIYEMIMGENKYYQFRPWMIYQDNNEYFQIININHIIGEAKPSESLLIHYYRVMNDIEENDNTDYDKLKEFLEQNDDFDSNESNLIKFPGNKNLH